MLRSLRCNSPGSWARVIATTSTAEKAKRLKALGASNVINYTETPDWDAKVRELTDGHGVDCIVEIGGPGTIAMSLKALAVGGHVSLIGASPSASGTVRSRRRGGTQRGPKPAAVNNYTSCCSR